MYRHVFQIYSEEIEMMNIKDEYKGRLRKGPRKKSIMA